MLFFDNLYQELTNQEIIERSVLERIQKRYNSFTQLLNIATTLYIYKNLSDDETENDIMSTNIERACMLSGFCAFVRNMDKWYPLPFVPSTVPSLEFRPTAGICIGYNGTTFQVSALDTPILKNTPFGWSALKIITDYSERIETIDTTSKGIVSAMQVPFIIRTPDGDTKNEVANEYSNAVMQRRPVIIRDSAVANVFDKEVSILNTNVNGDNLSKLTSYRSECFAQFMRYLGIKDMTGEKRERLLVGEVDLSVQSAKALSNPFEIARKENCKFLSEFLGREVTYERNEEEINNLREEINNGNSELKEVE